MAVSLVVDLYPLITEDHRRLGLHRISYPAPAEIRPNFHIRPYPAPAGYGSRIWGRIWPSFDASASLCNWAGIRCFKNSVICTSLFHHRHVDHTHILVSFCISLLVTWLHSYVMWCSLGLQLKNIRLQLQPDLQSQIRSQPDFKKPNLVQPYRRYTACD